MTDEEALLIPVIYITGFKLILNNDLFKLNFHQQYLKEQVNNLHKCIKMFIKFRSFRSNTRAVKRSQISKANAVLMPVAKAGGSILPYRVAQQLLR